MRTKSQDTLGPSPPDGYSYELPYGLRAIFDDLSTWPQFEGIVFDYAEPRADQPTTGPRALFLPDEDGPPEGPSDQIWLSDYRLARTDKPLEIPGRDPDGYVNYVPCIVNDDPVFVAHTVAGPSRKLRLRFDEGRRRLLVEIATDADVVELSTGYDIADAVNAHPVIGKVFRATGGPGIARPSQKIKMQSIDTRLQGCKIVLYADDWMELDKLLNRVWGEIRHTYGQAFQPHPPKPVNQEAEQANVAYEWPVQFKVPIYRELPGVHFLRSRVTVKPRKEHQP